MSQPLHTYGTTCHLARSVAFSGSEANDDIPELKAQFFYSSQLPIDDPLSAIPNPAGSEIKSIKYPPRPFSVSDNNALENAWLSLASENDRRNHHKSKHPKLGITRPTSKHASAGSVLVERPDKRTSFTGCSNGSTSDFEVAAKPSSKDKIETQKHPSASNSPTKASPPEESESTITRGPISCGCDGDILKYGAGKCNCPMASYSNSRIISNGCTCSHCESSQNEGLEIASEVCPKPSNINSTNPNETFGYSVPSTVCTRNPCKCNAVCRDGDPETCHVYSVEVTKRDHTKKNINDSSGNQRKLPSARRAEGINDRDQQRSLGIDQNRLPKSASDDHGSYEDPDYSEIVTREDLDSSRLENCDHRRRNDCNERPHPHHDTSRPDDSKRGRKAQRRTTSDSRSEADMQVGSEQHPFEGNGDGEIYHKRKSRPPTPPEALASKHPAIKDPVARQSTPSTFAEKGVKAGTTGLPFLKYSPPPTSPQPRSPSHRHTYREDENQILVGEEYDMHSGPESEEPESGLDPLCKAHKSTKDFIDVPVGTSRLHLVKLPILQMHPIYWSPVHDVSSVIRATWFYQESMYPVEPAVANQLEMGYRELRPWSQTWSDELNCALEVGAAGEEKIMHRLWPLHNPKGNLQTSSSSIVSGSSHCVARCSHGAAAVEGSIDSDDSRLAGGSKSAAKLFLQSHVIYKDAQNAFILKPTLQPSAYYGQRPLQKIKRGMTVGIPVVRGFHQRAWQKCHPSKKSKISAKVEEAVLQSGDEDAMNAYCPACRSLERRPNVSDLILVVHGIGQKLSERVESFHFTHAINNFRRSVNVELCNEGVQGVMRDDMSGIMVLPVNWRSTLSLDDGRPVKDRNQDGASDFSLRDITPETIPAVRNLISDVMLDIPFYMSHHKPKMIQALVAEANRVYCLWCKNNPEFHGKGRVHIIAHSLGSIMAVEVLSEQPTSVSEADILGRSINSRYFDFNTTNLFFCGSPAGFFLLLDKANLIPRRGQGKPGVEENDDTDESITGKAGTLGCLAVDNLYNILNYNDPIAYSLNATVDPQYSATLKSAAVPRATTGFFENVGNAMKSMAGVATPVDLAIGQRAKPAGVTRLPSQLEMAIHNFTREEVAEKKFSLLNDNAQIDWFLSTNGGPLEIQYINMLGAHSSYWTSPDFIRMVVIECGRKPGRKNVLPNMKAVKIGHKSK